MQDALLSIAREAGALALASWREGAPPDARVWDKVPGSLVCDVDLAVDALLKQRLGALAPDAGWLSEETADNADRLACRRLWLVDPIDGTRDYVRGRRGWGVSIALVEDGALVAGVVAAPARDELWSATRTGPALLNGAVLQAGNRRDLPGARVPADSLPKADRDLVTIEKPNSIALRMCMVAADRADLVATIRWGNEWDIAAAALIAERAGATVSDAHGDTIRYNKRDPKDFGMICAVPRIHGAAVERLRGRF